MALLGKGHERTDCFVYFIDYPVRCIHVVFGNEFPDFSEIGKRLRVKFKGAHERSEWLLSLF